MLYLCIPSFDEASTVGVLLWKIRKTFDAFPREYRLLVADDGSTDSTASLLEPYAKALPLTVVRHVERVGYARALEGLLRLAVEQTDRPKRDAAVIMSADFSHDPAYLPEFVKRLESGADLVVGEGKVQGETARGYRLVRRAAPWLLRGVRVPGVRDLVSGFLACRLVCLRAAFRSGPHPLLSTEGWAANAEIIGLAARHARRIDAVEVEERLDRRPRPTRVQPWPMARHLWREGGRLRLRVEPTREGRRAVLSAESAEEEMEEAAR